MATIGRGLGPISGSEAGPPAQDAGRSAAGDATDAPLTTGPIEQSREGNVELQQEVQDWKRQNFWRLRHQPSAPAAVAALQVATGERPEPKTRSAIDDGRRVFLADSVPKDRLTLLISYVCLGTASSLLGGGSPDCKL